jgi:LSD1 subclass zinc finger protein
LGWVSTPSLCLCCWHFISKRTHPVVRLLFLVTMDPSRRSSFSRQRDPYSTAQASSRSSSGSSIYSRDHQFVTRPARPLVVPKVTLKQPPEYSLDVPTPAVVSVPAVTPRILTNERKNNKNHLPPVNHHTSATGNNNADLFEQQKAIMRQIEHDMRRSKVRNNNNNNKRSSSSSSTSTRSTSNWRNLEQERTPTSNTSTSTPFFEHDRRAVPHEEEASNAEHDFCRYLQDAAAISDQRKILEQIQREQEEKHLAAARHDASTSVSQQLELVTASLQEAVRIQHACISSTPSQRRMQSRGPAGASGASGATGVTCSGYQTSTGTNSSSSTEKFVPTNDGICPSDQKDQIANFGGGNQKIRIQGTFRTYQAIANGTAILVHCVSCHTLLQLPESAKLLYCTHCHQVTPIDQAKAAVAVGDTEQFLALPQSQSQNDHHHHHHQQRNNRLSRFDPQIALTMQRQEMDVAFAQKMTTRGEASVASPTTTTTTTQSGSSISSSSVGNLRRHHSLYQEPTSR